MVLKSSGVQRMKTEYKFMQKNNKIFSKRKHNPWREGFRSVLLHNEGELYSYGVLSKHRRGDSFFHFYEHNRMESYLSLPSINRCVLGEIVSYLIVPSSLVIAFSSN